jgi:hypothetical protein
VRRLLAAALGLLLIASAAGAATIRGTARAERLVGTARDDILLGGPGRDSLHGRAGADFLDGGLGADLVDGGDGADRLSLETDATRDRARCGRGADVVTLDELDVAASDCETVTRRLSRDPFTGGAGQHATQAEPDSHAWGSTVVSVFQVARRTDGGAMDIGFATSLDGGTSWRSGRLPGVGVHSRPPGAAARVSDPVVGFDPVRAVWLAATLAVSPGRTQLLVSRSGDGLAWEPPVVAATSAAPELAFDKEWLACDAWAASPYLGRCYLSYTDLTKRRIATQFSADGGVSWSGQALVAPTGAGGGVGALPLPRPDGSLVLAYLDNRDVVTARSTDGGATFGAPATVAPSTARRVTGMRAPPLPSGDVAADGTVYLAWHDCAQRGDCAANDVVLASSPDGAAWSPPRRLPLVPATSSAELFLPALAVAGVAGRPHRISLVYHVMPNPFCSAATCRIDVRYADSRDGGRTWRTRVLIARPMRLGWIANTEQGRMLADYVSITLAGGRPVPVFALASPPQGRRFRQAIAATTRIR